MERKELAARVNRQFTDGRTVDTRSEFYEMTAKAWSNILDYPIRPEDVAKMLLIMEICKSEWKTDEELFVNMTKYSIMQSILTHNRIKELCRIEKELEREKGLAEIKNLIDTLPPAEMNK